MDFHDEIFSYPLSEPERLFVTADQITPIFNKMARQCHPDLNPGIRNAPEAFGYLVKLRNSALEKVRNKTWSTPGIVEIAGRKIRYFHLSNSEVGRAYIGNTVYATIVDAQENRDLALSMEGTISGISFPNAKLREAFSSRLPELITAFDTTDGGRAVVIKKPPGTIRLSDIIDKNGPLNPKHVAWVISDLLTVTVFFNRVMKIAHQGLSVDSVFIDPATHTTFVGGGWLYSRAIGAPLIALPEETIECAPSRALTRKTASSAFDTACIRSIGRRLLGDVDGGSFRSRPDIPDAMATWLRLPGGDDPQKDYKSWDVILEKSFGPRKFIEMPITAQQIYGKDAANG